jgi:serine protease inhibitor
MNTHFMMVAVCVVAACANDSTMPQGPEPERPLTVQEKDVAKANTAFGLNLLHQINATEPNGNLLLSPLSVSMALGMTLNGAATSTFDAMRQTLAFAGQTQNEINVAYNGLLKQLRARDPKIEIGIANSIWYNTGFAVLPTFSDTVKHYFDAEVRQVDFANPASPGVINDWVSQKTSGRIKDLIDQISPDEVMFLVNAVYFKGPWTQTFHEGATASLPFRRLDGSTVTARMMSNDGAYHWVQNDDVYAVELLYGDSAFSMVLIAPVAGTSLAPVAALLEPAKWEALMASMRPARVILKMPKFKFTYEKALKDALSALGMSVAFDQQRADLSRIANVKPENLYISRVQHKTYIDVHEKGTEAAGATSVGVGVTSMPPMLAFDKPFMFAIRERSTGTLLFVGRVVDPTVN